METKGEGRKSKASLVAGHTSCSFMWKASPDLSRRFVMISPITICFTGERVNETSEKS